MKPLMLVLAAALLAGCGGGDGDGNTEVPKPKSWKPPSSEQVTDLHYGMVVYLAGLDEMMKLGPKPRLTLCMLRRDTHKITVKQTHNPVKAGKSSRKILDKKELDERLMDYGKRLRGEMTLTERERFEALIPSELYGVKTSEKDGAGIAHFNVKFESDSTEELKAPWESRREFMSMDQVPELVTVKDRETLKAVLDVLKHHAEVDPAHRAAVCKAMVTLKDHETSLLGMVHDTFLRWCDKGQAEHFRPLLMSSPSSKTLLRYLELDEPNAIRFVVEDLPEEVQRTVLWRIISEMPEVARNVCHSMLDQSTDIQKVGIYYLGQGGTPEDIPLIVNAVKSSSDPKELSGHADGAFHAIKRRHPEAEVKIPDLKIKRK